MIEVTTKFDTLQINVHGKPHVRCKLSELLFWQAWKTGTSQWAIEYVMKGNTALSEYDDEAKWLAVLEGLDRVPFDQSRQS